jgi:hypothetical protein
MVVGEGVSVGTGVVVEVGKEVAVAAGGGRVGVDSGALRVSPAMMVWAACV